MELSGLRSLISYVKESKYIDHKDEILESLENNKWYIKSFHHFPQLGNVVDIEDNKGYFLYNLPLHLFIDESSIEMLITEYIKNNDKNKKK